MNLRKFTSVNFLKKIPENTNLFITQSAIEHFENDLDFFRQINQFIYKKDINAIQIHLFPAPPSLWLYLHHGVRQYNLRSLKKILEIFNKIRTYAVIYPLGGIHSYLTILRT